MLIIDFTNLKVKLLHKTSILNSNKRKSMKIIQINAVYGVEVLDISCRISMRCFTRKDTNPIYFGQQHVQMLIILRILSNWFPTGPQNTCSPKTC